VETSVLLTVTQGTLRRLGVCLISLAALLATALLQRVSQQVTRSMVSGVFEEAPSVSGPDSR
jgi:hypothetical protein